MQNVYYGSRGQDVRAVQDCLNYHLRQAAPLAVDGICGPKTDERVRHFQAVNGLASDGIVGPHTRAVMFEVTRLQLTVAIVPRLDLTPPRLGRPGFSAGGLALPSLRLPSLRPPGALPGATPSVSPSSPSSPTPSGFQLPDPLDVQRDLMPGPIFQLRQLSTGALPAPNPVVTALDLTVRLPTRKDPTDPVVRSRKWAIALIDRLPKDFPFRAVLLSKIPSKEIKPPSPGFGWGFSPLFKPDSGLGGHASASFSVEVSGGRDNLPTVVVGAWGEGKAFLDLAGQRARTGIRVQLDGKVWLGAKGTF